MLVYINRSREHAKVFWTERVRQPYLPQLKVPAQGHELPVEGDVGEAGGLPAVTHFLQLCCHLRAVALGLRHSLQQPPLLLVQGSHLRQQDKKKVL